MSLNSVSSSNVAIGVVAIASLTTTLAVGLAGSVWSVDGTSYTLLDSWIPTGPQTEPPADLRGLVWAAIALTLAADLLLGIRLLIPLDRLIHGSSFLAWLATVTAAGACDALGTRPAVPEQRPGQATHPVPVHHVAENSGANVGIALPVKPPRNQIHPRFHKLTQAPGLAGRASSNGSGNGGAALLGHARGVLRAGATINQLNPGRAAVWRIRGQLPHRPRPNLLRRVQRRPKQRIERLTQLVHGNLSVGQKPPAEGVSTQRRRRKGGLFSLSLLPPPRIISPHHRRRGVRLDQVRKLPVHHLVRARVEWLGRRIHKEHLPACKRARPPLRFPARTQVADGRLPGILDRYRKLV